MKKIFTLLAIVCTMAVSGYKAHAQSFTLSADTVYFNVSGTTVTNVNNNVAVPSGSVTLNWTVVGSDFPALWDTASGLCDNFLCYNLYDLWPSGVTRISDVYTPTNSHDFHLQLNQAKIAASSGCHYVRVKLVNVAAMDSTYSTFVVCNTPVGVNDIHAPALAMKVYPNPAMGEAVVSFNLNVNTDVDARLYDAAGRIVYSTVTKAMNSGRNAIAIPVADLASGIYTVRISAGNSLATEKLTVGK